MTMIRPSLRIDVVASDTGATVVLPEDPDLLAYFQAAFHQARLTQAQRTWYVAGRRAAKRLEQWARDQKSLLQVLEQHERDREWTVPAAPPVADKLRGPATFQAVPSRFSIALPPPEGAIEAALQGVERLDQQLADETAFGFLHQWISARVDTGKIMTIVHPTLTRRGTTSICIDWRWTVILTGEGWSDRGWLPCENAHALKNLKALWSAMNPSKGRIT